MGGPLATDVSGAHLRTPRVRIATSFPPSGKAVAARSSGMRGRQLAETRNRQPISESSDGAIVTHERRIGLCARSESQ